MLTFDEFKKMELKIAEVLEVKEHPAADKLLLLRISLGGEERQIVAGLKAHYKPEELQGRKIVVIANLEPAVLRGERSEGMLLAASEGDKVIFLTPEKDIAAGAKIS